MGGPYDVSPIVQEGHFDGRRLREGKRGGLIRFGASASSHDVNFRYVIASESTARMALLKQEETKPILVR